MKYFTGLREFEWISALVKFLFNETLFLNFHSSFLFSPYRNQAFRPHKYLQFTAEISSKRIAVGNVSLTLRSLREIMVSLRQPFSSSVSALIPRINLSYTLNAHRSGSTTCGWVTWIFQVHASVTNKEMCEVSRIRHCGMLQCRSNPPVIWAVQIALSCQ